MKSEVWIIASLLSINWQVSRLFSVIIRSFLKFWLTISSNFVRYLMVIKIENPLLMHLSEAEVTTNLSTYIWRSGPCHNWFESSSGPFKLKAPSLRLIPRATWGSSLDLLPTLNSVSKICKRTKIIFLHDRGVRRCRSKNSDLKNRGSNHACGQ